MNKKNSNRSKLSRREAALVREARRKAIRKYEKETLTGMECGPYAMSRMTLEQLKLLNFMAYGSGDLVMRVPLEKFSAETFSKIAEGLRDRLARYPAIREELLAALKES